MQQANTTLRMLSPVFPAAHLKRIHAKSYELRQKSPHSRLSIAYKAMMFQVQGEAYHDDNAAQNHWPAKSDRFYKYTQSFHNNYSTCIPLVNATTNLLCNLQLDVWADILLQFSTSRQPTQGEPKSIS